ncbi:MAG: ATP-binding protein [Firmicutes bacterium]|nr:ATP-binding protein [Bacillota bacterium]
MVRANQDLIEELRASYEELSALQLLSASLNTTYVFEEVLNLFMNLAGEIVEYAACALFLDEGGKFKLIGSRNYDSTQIDAILAKESGSGLLRWCLKENKITPIAYDELMGQIRDIPSSFILVPVVSHQRAIGILMMECHVPSAQITQQEIILLSLLSGQTAVACENANLYKGLHERNIELAKLKNYLSSILENVTTGIIALDKEGRITSLNRSAEKILSLKSEKAVGKLFFELFSEPLRTTFRDILLSSMIQAEASSYELDAELDNKILPLALSTSLLRDEKGDPTGFVVACRDISETKELDAMRKLSQLKTEFLSSISHELRTPLTSIKAYSETLINLLDRLPLETRMECLKIIDSEADRLARLLDDLLDFSRMESGKLKLALQEINLVELIEQVVSQMKFDSSKHSIAVNFPFIKAPILADPDRIKQALINLFSNAIKYSPEGGKIECAIKDEGDSFSVFVKDSGIGIPSETLPHIFEKFYRGEGPEMIKIRGTGLGLSITKAIVEAHGGKIDAESQVGKGTIISFILPKLSS